jgi:hypothetical protein
VQLKSPLTLAIIQEFEVPFELPEVVPPVPPEVVPPEVVPPEVVPPLMLTVMGGGCGGVENVEYDVLS